MVKVVTIKNIYDSKLAVVAEWGTTGYIIDKYEWGPHKYICVFFENGKKQWFGDENHPLISYKGHLKLVVPHP